MNKNSLITLDNDVKILVEYNYYEGDPGVWRYSNGDPGYPPTPDELEVQDITLVSGKLVDLLFEVGNTKNWWDWLEGKLFELND